MMFLLAFKKIVSRVCVLSLLLCLFSGVAFAVDFDDANNSKSRLYTHNNSSGGTGREVVRLSKPKKLLAGHCALFVSAKIVDDKLRFGEVRLVSSPKKNCNAASGMCRATVEWMHTPVGYVNYRVEAKWKVKSGC